MVTQKSDKFEKSQNCLFPFLTLSWDICKITKNNRIFFMFPQNWEILAHSHYEWVKTTREERKVNHDRVRIEDKFSNERINIFDI